jgi:membrane-bound serine protease (ClpP class)
MIEGLGIGLLYLLGIALMIIEVFVPAHGLLGLVGLGIFAYSIYLTTAHSVELAIVATVAILILLPLGLIWSVKNWHRTPVGKRISPPNPMLTDNDRMPVEQASELIGQKGLTVTPLRPVGMCEFNGKRVECVAAFGMIEANVQVRGVRLVDRTLSVEPIEA